MDAVATSPAGDTKSGSQRGGHPLPRVPERLSIQIRPRNASVKALVKSLGLACKSSMPDVEQRGRSLKAIARNIFASCWRIPQRDWQVVLYPDGARYPWLKSVAWGPSTQAEVQLADVYLMMHMPETLVLLYSLVLPDTAGTTAGTASGAPTDAGAAATVEAANAARTQGVIASEQQQQQQQQQQVPDGATSGDQALPSSAAVNATAPLAARCDTGIGCSSTPIGAAAIQQVSGRVLRSAFKARQLPSPDGAGGITQPSSTQSPKQPQQQLQEQLVPATATAAAAVVDVATVLVADAAAVVQGWPCGGAGDDMDIILDDDLLQLLDEDLAGGDHGLDGTAGSGGAGFWELFNPEAAPVLPAAAPAVAAGGQPGCAAAVGSGVDVNVVSAASHNAAVVDTTALGQQQQQLLPDGKIAADAGGQHVGDCLLTAAPPPSTHSVQPVQEQPPLKQPMCAAPVDPSAAAVMSAGETRRAVSSAAWTQAVPSSSPMVAGTQRVAAGYNTQERTYESSYSTPPPTSSCTPLLGQLQLAAAQLAQQSQLQQPMLPPQPQQQYRHHLDIWSSQQAANGECNASMQQPLVRSAQHDAAPVQTTQQATAQLLATHTQPGSFTHHGNLQPKPSDVHSLRPTWQGSSPLEQHNHPSTTTYPQQRPPPPQSQQQQQQDMCAQQDHPASHRPTMHGPGSSSHPLTSVDARPLQLLQQQQYWPPHMRCGLLAVRGCSPAAAPSPGELQSRCSSVSMPREAHLADGTASAPAGRGRSPARDELMDDADNGPPELSRQSRHSRMPNAREAAALDQHPSHRRNPAPASALGSAPLPLLRGNSGTHPHSSLASQPSVSPPPLMRSQRPTSRRPRRYSGSSCSDRSSSSLDESSSGCDESSDDEPGHVPSVINAGRSAVGRWHQSTTTWDDRFGPSPAKPGDPVGSIFRPSAAQLAPLLRHPLTELTAGGKPRRRSGSKKRHRMQRGYDEVGRAPDGVKRQRSGAGGINDDEHNGRVGCNSGRQSRRQMVLFGDEPAVAARDAHRQEQRHSRTRSARRQRRNGEHAYAAGQRGVLQPGHRAGYSDHDDADDDEEEQFKMHRRSATISRAAPRIHQAVTSHADRPRHQQQLRQTPSAAAPLLSQQHLKPTVIGCAATATASGRSAASACHTQQAAPDMSTFVGNIGTALAVTSPAGGSLLAMRHSADSSHTAGEPALWHRASGGGAGVRHPEHDARAARGGVGGGAHGQQQQQQQQQQQPAHRQHLWQQQPDVPHHELVSELRQSRLRPNPAGQSAAVLHIWQQQQQQQHQPQGADVSAPLPTASATTHTPLSPPLHPSTHEVAPLVTQHSYPAGSASLRGWDPLGGNTNLGSASLRSWDATGGASNPAVSTGPLAPLAGGEGASSGQKPRAAARLAAAVDSVTLRPAPRETLPVEDTCDGLIGWFARVDAEDSPAGTLPETTAAAHGERRVSDPAGNKENANTGHSSGSCAFKKQQQQEQQQQHPEQQQQLAGNNRPQQRQQQPAHAPVRHSFEVLFRPSMNRPHDASCGKVSAANPNHTAAPHEQQPAIVRVCGATHGQQQHGQQQHHQRPGSTDAPPAVQPTAGAVLTSADAAQHPPLSVAAGPVTAAAAAVPLPVETGGQASNTAANAPTTSTPPAAAVAGLDRAPIAEAPTGPSCATHHDTPQPPTAEAPAAPPASGQQSQQAGDKQMDTPSSTTAPQPAQPQTDTGSKPCGEHAPAAERTAPAATAAAAPTADGQAQQQDQQPPNTAAASKRRGPKKNRAEAAAAALKKARELQVG